jgi:hypothetical protein
MGAHTDFLKIYARGQEGPMDLFKGFQQEPKEPFQLINWSDPGTKRLVDPAKVGHRAPTQIFSRSVPEDKGTCGFVQGVPTGSRREISTQKLERSKDREVSGLCRGRGFAYLSPHDFIVARKK